MLIIGSAIQIRGVHLCLLLFIIKNNYKYLYKVKMN
jgi:hypothetical protein